MESLLVMMFFGGGLCLIFGGALGSGDVAFLGFLLIILSTLTSVGTGKGSSFGPNATHSSKYPWRRK